jgi:hypothetical protein
MVTGSLAALLSVHAVARGVDRLVARLGDRARPGRADANDERPIYRTRLPLTGLWIELRRR